MPTRSGWPPTYALGCLRDKAAVPALSHILGSREQPASLRGQAAEALGSIADKSSFEVLVEATRDVAAEVRFWAAFALGQLADARAQPVLEVMARDDHAVVEGWWEVSREALDALEQLTDD